MGERLDEEYKFCCDLKLKWDAGNREIVERLDKIKVDYSRAKCFYDLTLMLTSTSDLTNSVNNLGRIDNKLLKMTNEVNSKVRILTDSMTEC